MKHLETISDMTLVIFLPPLYWHFTAGIRVVHRRYYLTFQMESLCITQLNTGGKGERNAIILKILISIESLVRVFMKDFQKIYFSSLEFIYKVHAFIRLLLLLLLRCQK